MFFLVLLGICLLIFANPFSAEDKEKMAFSEEKGTAAIITNIDTNKLNAFKFREELKKEGYSSFVDFALLPNEKVEIIINLTKEVTQAQEEKIKEIIQDFLNQNGLALNSFEISVANFYAKTIKHNESAKRISYVDLQGYIFENLTKENYGLAVSHEVLEDQTIFHISLSKEDFNNENTKIKIEKIAYDTIKEKKFKGDFKVNLTVPPGNK